MNSEIEAEIALVMPDSNRDTVVVSVNELSPGDRIISGNSLGPFNSLDDITVKKVDEAGRGKHYVMLFNVGALYLPSTALLTILDKSSAKRS